MALHTVVRGVGHFVPEQVVTNDDLARLMDTSDEWIRERTGIQERRFVQNVTPASELGVHAAKLAIEQAGVSPTAVDYVIAATLSPDYYFPGIGTLLQHKLGLQHVPALDVRAQCSGLVYGLAVADSLIRAGAAKTLLLVCAEVQSIVLDFSTSGRDTAVLFGDGAGALVLAAEEGQSLPGPGNGVRGVIDSLLGSDGSGAELLCVEAPGSGTPGFLSQEVVNSAKWRPRMDGRQVFKHAVTRMGDTAEAILQRNGVGAEDIALLIPHQANLRINEAVRERLGLRPEQVFNNIERYGNTTAATIPICMSEAVEQGRLKQGDLVLTLAFGAGFTWGANLLRW
ncbi:MAG: ketoacyl-ACP synthase III [Bdellovibrionales bacterium]|nr:ketoacyl-ACP synthase III [Bdellovibrionales bacterium]